MSEALLWRRANAWNVSQHTLYGVQHIHIDNITLINCTFYRHAKADQNSLTCYNCLRVWSVRTCHCTETTVFEKRKLRSDVKNSDIKVVYRQLNSLSGNSCCVCVCVRVWLCSVYVCSVCVCVCVFKTYGYLVLYLAFAIYKDDGTTSSVSLTILLLPLNLVIFSIVN